MPTLTVDNRKQTEETQLKRKKMLKTIIATVITILVALPLSALACACCADHGTYSIWTGRPSSYDLEVIGGIKFDKKAHLFVTEAEFEIIKGLDPIKDEFKEGNWTPDSEKMDLLGSFLKNTWTVDFVTKGGKKGSLVLPLPTQMLKFKVDIHEKRDGDPLLYKEFRFNGPVKSGSGFFKAGIGAATKYFLVFQGRGNGCDNVEDFSHWRLEINGPKARYAFFGHLASGPTEESESK